MIETSKEDADLVGHLRSAAVSLDGDRFDECSDRFHEHVDHLQEVCKLLRHVAPVESLQVTAKYAGKQSWSLHSLASFIVVCLSQTSLCASTVRRC